MLHHVYCCCVFLKKNKKIKIRSLPFHCRPIWKRNAQHDDRGGQAHSGEMLKRRPAETSGRLSTARGRSKVTERAHCKQNDLWFPLAHTDVRGWWEEAVQTCKTTMWLSQQWLLWHWASKWRKCHHLGQVHRKGNGECSLERNVNKYSSKPCSLTWKRGKHKLGWASHLGLLGLRSFLQWWAGWLPLVYLCFGNGRCQGWLLFSDNKKHKQGQSPLRKFKLKNYNIVFKWKCFLMSGYSLRARRQRKKKKTEPSNNQIHTPLVDYTQL